MSGLTEKISTQVTDDVTLRMNLAWKLAMKERRTDRRYKVLLPVALNLLLKPKTSGLVRARTRDVSTEGLYFTTARRLAVGTRFGFSPTLPIKTTNGGDVMIDAQARVVRVEGSSQAVLKFKHLKM